ncbi:hypothetical protein [Eubacterium sp.]|uniref:hypothetical protein n=1 Tax=Eubacterium TaxID=1730 RepID=UPI0035210DDF
MITLDYRTDNPRWGLSGISYSSWEAYAFALGYLANVLHYRNRSHLGLIELHFESNDAQGAWGKEGRIHYYGDELYLLSVFPDWYKAKSAGVGSITYRINSNDYMYSLVYDFDFEVKRNDDYTTADIFPPIQNAFIKVWDKLKDYLVQKEYSNVQINQIHEHYIEGWNE